MGLLHNTLRLLTAIIGVLLIFSGQAQGQSLRFTDTGYAGPGEDWYAKIFNGGHKTTGQMGTYTTPEGSTLPVSNISIAANPELKRVRLNWSTSNEVNNHHFNIERSVNGTAFKKIGELPGSGNISTDHDFTFYYTFYDDKPVKGKSFYRLKQVDIDNQFKYSDITAVRYVDKIRFEIFPNPVKGTDINIFFNESVKGEVTILINDRSGKEIKKHRYTDPAGKIRLRSNLSAGIYTVLITGKDINAAEKIVVRGKR